MDKQLIKCWLINKKPKVYSVIISCYIDKLTMLQTALFIEWLSRELDVPQSIINKSSVSSALRRYRNKTQSDDIIQLGQKSKRIKDPFDLSLPQQLKFK